MGRYALTQTIIHHYCCSRGCGCERVIGRPLPTSEAIPIPSHTDTDTARDTRPHIHQTCTTTHNASAYTHRAIVALAQANAAIIAPAYAQFQPI